MQSEIKEATELIMREGRVEDYEPIVQLCDERYGKGYVNCKNLSRWTECPSLFLVAELDGCFAGFSVFVPETVQAVAEYMSMPIQDVLVATEQKPLLIYKSAALVTAFEGRGRMSLMVQKQLQTAKELGYGAVFASAWEYDGKIPMAGVFARLGFEPLYRREKLWHHIKDYSCVICKGSCLCNAMIYQKRL